MTATNVGRERRAQRSTWSADPRKQQESPISSVELALVDSGSEHIFADAWMAELAGIDLSNPHHVTTVGLGGQVHEVRFVFVSLRLQHPGRDDDDYVEWETEVGFLDTWRATWPVLLGQYGFFDRFTISMHRAAQATVVEEWDAFDERFRQAPEVD